MLKSSLSIIVLQRVWQGLAGVLTVLVIGLTLSEEQQGWYYTFLSLSALYSLFEMGLTTALIQVTAHMFVKMHWLPQGRVAGENSELFKSFFIKSIKIYLLLALVFLLISLIVGFYIFSYKSSLTLKTSAWILPWLFLVMITALNMVTLPFLAVVEGGGGIAEVYKVKLLQGVLGAIATWVVLSIGGWLWATMMLPLFGILTSIYWLVKKRIFLLKVINLNRRGAFFNWSNEIFPFQWRVGLNWISVFVMSQLATPILFYYQTPVIAGQIGLSLTIAHMLGIVAQSWIARRLPALSQAVARREWEILDLLFIKDFKNSLFVFVLGAVIAIAMHYGVSNTEYSSRMLPFWPFVGLLGFVFFYHINGAFASQLRSFKREPLVWVSLIGAAIILPGIVYTAKKFSVNEVVLVMLSAEALIVFPLSFLLWRKYNKKWRLATEKS